MTILHKVFCLRKTVSCNVGLRKRTICQADRNEGNFPDHSSDFSESEMFEDDLEVAEPIPVPVGEAGPIPVPVEEAGPIPAPVEEAGPIPVPGEEVAPPIPLPVEEIAPPIALPVEELGPPAPLLELDYQDGIRTPEQIVRLPEARRGVNPPPIPPAPPPDNLADVGPPSPGPGPGLGGFMGQEMSSYFELELEGGKIIDEERIQSKSEFLEAEVAQVRYQEERIQSKSEFLEAEVAQVRYQMVLFQPPIMPARSESLSVGFIFVAIMAFFSAIIFKLWRIWRIFQILQILRKKKF